MAGKYTVDTSKGYANLDALDAGVSSVKGSDGSVWTKNSNGGYTATTADGRVLDIETPGRVSTTGGGASNNSTGPAAKANTTSAPPGYYVVDSQKGADLLNQLDAGASSVTATDGSTWTRNADGSYTAQSKYGTQQIIENDGGARKVSQANANLNAQWQAQMDALNAQLESNNAQWQAQMDALSAKYQNDADSLQKLYDTLSAQYQNKISYDTNQGIENLRNQYENSLSDYNRLISENAITSAQAADNLALRNAAAGDMGGIGGKLYSDQQASYDSDLYEIKLQQLNLYNSVEQQAEALRAQGEYELANAVLEIGSEKIQALMDLEDSYFNNNLNLTQYYNSLSRQDAETAKSDAYKHLQMGYYNEADLNALGMDKPTADTISSFYANQYKAPAQELAQMHLEMGYYTPEDLEALGIDTATADRIKNYYLGEYQPVATSGGSRSSGSGSSGTKSASTSLFNNKDILSADPAKLLYDYSPKDYDDAYNYLYRLYASAGKAQGVAQALADSGAKTFIANRDSYEAKYGAGSKLSSMGDAQAERDAIAAMYGGYVYGNELVTNKVTGGAMVIDGFRWTAGEIARGLSNGSISRYVDDQTGLTTYVMNGLPPGTAADNGSIYVPGWEARSEDSGDSQRR